MRLYFTLMGVALLCAAVCGAALAWDGSYYLFKALDTQAPFTPHDRLTNVLLQWPVILTSHWTSNVAVLRMVYGLSYAVIPFLALALSWWIVRKSAPLFVWAALGIGLGTLPGQINLNSEGLEVIQLFWPILLSILIRLPGAQMPVVALLVTYIFLGHPAAAVLLAFGAAVAVFIGLMYRDSRLKMLLCACALAGLALVRYRVIHAGYEAHQLSTGVQEQAFSASVAGLPLGALSCAFVAAVMVLVSAYINRASSISGASRQKIATVVRFCELAGVAMAGLLLLVWSRDARLWAGAIGFKSWAVASSLPFMVLAVVDCVVGRAYMVRDAGDLVRARTRVIQAVGWVFLIVLYCQSRVFASITGDLQKAMAQAAGPCLSIASVEGLGDTALNHWSVVTYAVLLQGRIPHRVVLTEDRCVAARLSDKVQLVPFDDTTDGRGWFDLQAVRSQLMASRGCWFALSPGWYPVERDGPMWWQWSTGQGDVRVFAPRRMRVTVFGRLKSVRQPNKVDVLVNGKEQTTLSLTGNVSQPVVFAPLTVWLQAGANVIEFRSHNRASLVRGDRRPLAMALFNLSLMTAADSTVPACQLQT